MFKRYLLNLLHVALALAGCGLFTYFAIGAAGGEIDPEQIDNLLTDVHLMVLGGLLLLLLAIPRLTKAFWNVVYCVTSIVLFAALFSWVSQNIVMPHPIRALVEPCTIPSLFDRGEYWLMGSFILLWAMGASCCLGLWRVTLTALGCYAVWLVLSLAFYLGVAAWCDMGDSAPLVNSRLLFERCPWITTAAPGVFVLLYGTLMSIYDAFGTPWRKKRPAAAPAEAAEEAAPAPAQEKKPAAPIAKAAPIKKKKTTTLVKKTAAAAPAPEEKPAPTPEEKPAPEEK